VAARSPAHSDDADTNGGAGMVVGGVREDCVVQRTIIGRASGRTMTLGDLRKFLASLDGIGDETPVKARVTLAKHLRSITVEDDEPGLKEYLRSIGTDPDDNSDSGNDTNKSTRPRARSKA
jgi:hypothetical protein